MGFSSSPDLSALDQYRTEGKPLVRYLEFGRLGDNEKRQSTDVVDPLPVCSTIVIFENLTFSISLTYAMKNITDYSTSVRTSSETVLKYLKIAL